MDVSSLKRCKEKTVAEILIKTLHIKDIFFSCMGNDKKEPDIIFSQNNKKIGIEVSTAYLGNGHAKIIWDYVRNKTTEPDSLHNVIRPSEKICLSLQKRINSKIKKSFKYCGVDETWLCLEDKSPLSDDVIINNCVKNLVVGKNCFDHIYILHNSPAHKGGGYKVFSLK